jgi:dynactin complex subunit
MINEETMTRVVSAIDTQNEQLWREIRSLKAQIRDLYARLKQVNK